MLFYFFGALVTSTLSRKVLELRDSLDPVLLKFKVAILSEPAVNENEAEKH